VSKSTRKLFVGLDVHKDSIAVAYAPQERGAEIISLGTIGTRQSDIDKLLKKLVARSRNLEFVYEAGPCGYGIYRQICRSAYGIDQYQRRNLSSYKLTESLNHVLFEFGGVVNFGG